MIKKTIANILLIIFPVMAFSQCWTKIAQGGIHTLAIHTDGTLWAWGNNESGELGDGTNINWNIPVQIGTSKNWKDVSAGYKFSLAMKTDGSLWAWGNNIAGQLGLGSNENAILTPTQIGNTLNWSMITAGFGSSYAIKTDGTLWAWGDNIYGQLGDNTKTNRNTPVQIGTANNWKQIKGGGTHAIALKLDGTLWTWGNNLYGQLGVGNFSSGIIFPAQVGSAINWKSVSAGTFFNIALKTDGTLWGWGDNNDGQTGDGTFITKNTPTQAGSSNDWKLISAGSYYSTAIKNDGTFWAWGNNSLGQLGDNTIINKNTPVQTVTGQDWLETGAGFGYTTLALKNNNSLWAWGDNTYGQVGNGTTINSKIPLQIACSVVSGVVDNPIDNEIKIYPNPVRDILFITTINKISRIEILNLHGMLIKQSVNSNKIDITTLEKGNYLVKIYTLKRIIVKKIIKE